MKKIAIERYIRSTCKHFEPYIAGRPISEIKREFKLKSVVKLASNENPLGPSVRAITALKKSAPDIYFYPDSNAWALKQAIAKKFKISTDRIILGAGSDEIIELIAKTFFNSIDEIIVSKHAFIRYKMAGELMNCQVRMVPMKNYAHDLRAMREAVTSHTKALFIANPNNPTGTYNTKQEIEWLLKSLEKEKNPPLVISDEAYYEYASGIKDYPETTAYLRRYANLIILRTFSKIYGLAGVRAGYGFASPEVVSYLDRIRPPFNLSIPAQEAAVASLGDAGQVKKSVKLVTHQKTYLSKQLQSLGVPFIPSAANFLLIDVSPMAGRKVFQRLLRKGIIVRAMDEYDLPQHIRVTIGLPAENALFIRKLRDVLTQKDTL